MSPPGWGGTEESLKWAKWAVRKLRQRYRELFRDEIAHTVSRPEEIDDEIRHLLAVLQKKLLGAEHVEIANSLDVLSGFARSRGALD